MTTTASGHAPQLALSAPPGMSALTMMTSREIADLVESRHDKVKQSIERLVDRGVIVRPPMGDEQFHDALGRPRAEAVYQIGKRDSYIIVAQLSPEFTARLVDRWQELEARVPAPAILTTMDILLIAMESEQARIAAEQRATIAIATKAQIGSKREATAMATAAIAVRQVNRLQAELGHNRHHATMIAVENASNQKFGPQGWRPLKKWCDEHGVVPKGVTDARYGEVKAWPADAWGSIYGIDLEELFAEQVGQ